MAKLSGCGFESRCSHLNLTGIDNSKFAKKADLASLNSDINKVEKKLLNSLNSLKSEVDKLDVDK